MKKFYNFETDNFEIKDALSKYCKENNIYYECSGCYDLYHLEIKASEKECEEINNFLDSLY